MHYITYKKFPTYETSQNDLIHWQKINKPFNSDQTTTSIKLWNKQEGKKNIVFCRYSIKNIDQF